MTPDLPTEPFRPCWANPGNETLRRVYRDGVNDHRRGHGTREWERWAGWRAVQVELARTIAHTAAFRPDATPHPADVELFKRVVSHGYKVAPS